jgi:hypothetical protein
VKGQTFYIDLRKKKRSTLCSGAKRHDRWYGGRWVHLPAVANQLHPAAAVAALSASQLWDGL